MTTLSESLVVTEYGDLEEYGRSVFMDTWKPIKPRSNRIWGILIAVVWFFALIYSLLV